MADDYFQRTTDGPIPGARYMRSGQGLYLIQNPGSREGVDYARRVEEDLQDARRRGGNAEIRKLAESDPDKYGQASVGWYDSVYNNAKTTDIPEYDASYLANIAKNGRAYTPEATEFEGKFDPYLEALHNAFKAAQGMSDAPAGVGPDASTFNTIDTVNGTVVPKASQTAMAADGTEVALMEAPAEQVLTDLASSIAEQERQRQLNLMSNNNETLLGDVSYTLGG